MIQLPEVWVYWNIAAPTYRSAFFVNRLCTDSIKSISDFRNGHQRFEQYSRIGLTNTVNALNRVTLFLDLKQFKIMEAFRLALLQIALIWREKDRSCENLTPKSKTYLLLIEV